MKAWKKAYIISNNMRHLIFIVVILICISVKGQTVVVQPVVCTSTADGGNIAITSTPVISAEDASIFYQGGFISFVPGSVDAGVDGEIVDKDMKIPAFDGHRLNLSAYPGVKNIDIYNLEGKLLTHIEIETEAIDLSCIKLPRVFFLVINHTSGKYVFKYCK